MRLYRSLVLALSMTLSASIMAQGLYEQAVKDALTIESEELLPVVSLAKGEPLVRYDEQERVLLLTLHAYPDSYPTGTDMTLNYDCWSFTDKEFAAWYERNSQEVNNWTLRLNQLLGLPAQRKSTHITALWADPKQVIRPAYNTDVFSTDSVASFSSEVDPNFKSWFDRNIIKSYFSANDYPWTRLGYTYDWAHAQQGEQEYGLSEFWVPKGTDVTIEYTLSIEDFIAKIQSETVK